MFGKKQSQLLSRGMEILCNDQNYQEALEFAEFNNIRRIPAKCGEGELVQRYNARIILITLIGISLIFVWLAGSAAKSQQLERIVVRKPWRVEPVKVVAVKTKHKESIEIDKAFGDDDDWLDGFTVTVVNN